MSYSHNQMTKIKICGLKRPCDIEAVNIAKPDYIGFVFAQSRRGVTAEEAADLKRELDSDILAVGVFVNEDMETVCRLADEGMIDLIQLHGQEDEDYIERIKAMTGKPVIKAIPVQNKGDVLKWRSTRADYLLFDNKQGGTGESFDWSLIEKIEKPFFLAGGINSENVKNAINQVTPFAVDISSGVETDGLKDREKIISIIRRVKDE